VRRLGGTVRKEAAARALEHWAPEQKG